MKKKCLGLLILMSLAVPSPSQTIYNPCPESCPRSELIKAYDSFFAVTWKLILYDKMQPVTVTPRGLKRPQNADNWLKEQLFSPSDIERIENAVSDWHTLRQAIWDAAEAAAAGPAPAAATC